MHEIETAAALERLLFFARQNGLIDKQDVDYHRNLLLDALRLGAPMEADGDIDYLPLTATPMLEVLTDYAAKEGIIGDTLTEKELFSARLMGLLTPHPAMVRKAFKKLMKNEGPDAALDWFYKLCRDNDYIRVDQIAKNVRYFKDTQAGELEITINLSKPEKDPREIARLKEQKAVGYPLCMLCKENVGYAGRLDFPARQNHRMVPLKLDGERWYLQYSPYLYYNEHCIVLNEKHVPMKIDVNTFRRQFDFVDQFPHYFVGSNADLPIVGGSILNHDHFQGGAYEFPMDKAKTRKALLSPDGDAEADLLDWPLSAIRLKADDARPLIYWADAILAAWREYSDAGRQIIARTGDTPHNTITPILRKRGKKYELNLVLRNNRTSDEHPLGIFHPHAKLHPVKKENIGLIEVMGLFILPGRLKSELAAAVSFLTGERALSSMTEEDICFKHLNWLCDLVNTHGARHHAEKARALLDQAVADICAQVLDDCGVFKRDADGLNGFMQFMQTVSFVER